MKSEKQKYHTVGTVANGKNWKDKIDTPITQIHNAHFPGLVQARI